MLFNSLEFLFLFLPVTAAVFFLIGGFGRPRFAIAWLVVASVFFYGYWNASYVPLLLFSVVFNYFLGEALQAEKKKWMLTAGILVNLGLLGYFKYAMFIVENLRFLPIGDLHVILPIGISFLTFEQIAYLVDTYRGQTPQRDFVRYCWFITLFPRLIAGPIVRAREILPQFGRRSFGCFNTTWFATGLTIFVIGLFKKVICADHVGSYATHVFRIAENGTAITFYEAWGGALAFTCQIYFDFSGYSDMAIGIARMFGIVLPLNFNSPYKASSIIEFWRRWHMSLSRFLRDYLYIPLGGDRKGTVRRYLNLMITMLVAGLWHGAGWTFVAWGALHGLYLCVNHAWRAARVSLGHDLSRTTWWGRGSGTIVTLGAVMVAWLFFRAPSFSGALNMLAGMAGMNGLGGTSTSLLGYLIAPFLLLVCLIAPNTQEIVGHFEDESLEQSGSVRPQVQPQFLWRPNLSWSIVIGLMFFLAIVSLTEENEFIYFRF